MLVDSGERLLSHSLHRIEPTLLTGFVPVKLHFRCVSVWLNPASLRFAWRRVQYERHEFLPKINCPPWETATGDAGSCLTQSVRRLYSWRDFDWQRRQMEMRV